MFNFLKKFFRNTIVHRCYAGIKNGVLRFRGLRIPEQDFATSASARLLSFGSNNAQWVCLDRPLRGEVVVSLGAGEDISWDVEIQAALDCKLVIVDATPRAVAHVESVFAEIASTGAVSAYQTFVQGVKRESFKLVKKYVWTSMGYSEAFSPPNPQHVSHSLIDFQGGYKKAGDHIVVPTITMKALLEQEKVSPKELKILKMDIEGAEVEVISQMLSEGIKPHQILVEYDELGFPTKKGIERVRGSIDMLYAAGYELAWASGVSDFLFVRSDT